MGAESRETAAGEPEQDGTPAPGQPAWQAVGMDALRTLEFGHLPGFEIIYLDRLAVLLLGPESLAPPYTVESGTAIVSSLLRSLADARHFQPEPAPAATPGVLAGRQQVLAGSHALAARRLPGLHQLVQRVVGASVGELELHKEEPEHQVRSLFHHGLLAVASGPQNLLAQEAADGCLEVFHAWDRLIGDGFVPPWRRPKPAES